MPDCRYCDESFPDEEAYLDHLREVHRDELSRIDRRRVEDAESEEGVPLTVVYGAIAVVVLLLSVAVYVVVLSGGGSTPIEAQPLPERGDETLLGGVEQFPSEGRSHVAPGTEVDYSTSPPTSGPHYDRWIEAGFYEEPQAAGNLVHSLEHGHVVIYYDPAAITPEAEESLRAFARNHDDRFASVVVVPNPKDDPDSAYVLTAWTVMLRMDDYDPRVVRAFMAEYLGRGPEQPVR